MKKYVLLLSCAFWACVMENQSVKSSENAGCNSSSMAKTSSTHEVEFFDPMDISQGSVKGVTSIDAGDIDGDGFPDIAVIEGGKHAGGRETFDWFANPGDINGEWKEYSFHSTPPLRSFLGAARLRDMDGDGNLDLVVPSDHHSGSKREADVLVFFNPGSNSVDSEDWDFVHAARDLDLHHINDMEIGDMDGDGKLDIIMRSLEPNQIHILFQNAESDWTLLTLETGLEQSEGLTVADFDSDGKLDIAYTGYLFKGNSKRNAGSFTKIEIDPEFHTVNQNTKEAAGDMDGDGKLDLVIGPAESYRGGKDHHLAWYSNPGGNLNSEWKKNIIEEKTNGMHTVKVVDMDNNGMPDVLVGRPWDNEVLIYYNSSNLQFGKQTVSNKNGLYSGLAVDLDHDDDMDIVGQNRYSGSAKPYVYESKLEKPTTSIWIGAGEPKPGCGE